MTQKERNLQDSDSPQKGGKTNSAFDGNSEKPDQLKNYEASHFIDTTKPVWNYSLLTDEDVNNYQNGTHYSLYKKFGSHSVKVQNVWGMYFCVWAPNATSLTVIGNFNDWNKTSHPLFPRWDKSGI